MPDASVGHGPNHAGPPMDEEVLSDASVGHGLNLTPGGVAVAAANDTTIVGAAPPAPGDHSNPDFRMGLWWFSVGEPAMRARMVPISRVGVCSN